MDFKPWAQHLLYLGAAENNKVLQLKYFFSYWLAKKNLILKMILILKIFEFVKTFQKF